MIVEGLIQGTPEWLEWRRKHVCASDIPALMGESDFGDTPRSIWKIKTGRAEEKESNFAMTRGTEKEPLVRALYALENSIDVPPAVVEHHIFRYMAASLDGYNPEGDGLVIEIKYPGREKHEMAKAGFVPPCYRGQIQTQLFCSGAKYCDYVSYSDPAIAVVRVGRDEDYMNRLVQVATDFWRFVETDTPPPITEQDFLEVDDLKYRVLFDEWKNLRLVQMQLEEIPTMKRELKEIETKIKDVRERIREHLPHPKVLCSGVKVITVKRKAGPTLDIRFAEG